MTLCNNVKIWIQLQVPKVEDGNNFGVAVQEDMINDLARAEDASLMVFDNINKYYMGRAKLISKVAKYPNLDDYKMAIKEMDDKQVRSIWLVFSDLRNNYSVLHDSLVKNMEKLINPRNVTASTMMY